MYEYVRMGVHGVADLSLSLRRESKVRYFIEVGREFQSLMADE